MKQVILQAESVRGGAACGIPSAILRYLPIRLVEELTRCRAVLAEELRLHGGGRSCLLTGRGTLPLESVLDAAEMMQILNELCGGSMYAHMQTLREGYVTLSGGIRVGVCGRLQRHEDKALGLCEVTSLIFRFPRAVPLAVRDVCGLLRRHPGRGLLIYAPPGAGKTTLLRAMIRELAAPSSGWRVAVVDTREELVACGTGTDLCADWLLGYPRAQGIEIATRTLGAQVILCDEIGGTEEAEAIGAACNAGVALVASAHGAELSSLLRRRGIRTLHEQGVFGSYIGLTRTAGQELTRRVTSADEVRGL